MKHTTRVLATGLLAIAATGCIRYADIDQAMSRHKLRDLEKRFEQLNGTYKIGIPDTISIHIPDHPDLSGIYEVRTDGNISFPLLHDVYVEGFTPMELSKELAKRLEPYAEKVDALVTIRQPASKVYYIFSRPKNGGRAADFHGNVSVIDALAANGGWARSEALSSRIRLIRNNPLEREVYRIRGDRMVRGDLRTNVLVKEGDIVYVPATWFAEFTYTFEMITRPIRALVSGGYAIGSAPYAFQEGRYAARRRAERDIDRAEDDRF